MFGKYFDKLDPDIRLGMGETLFTEGDNGDKAYVICSGNIDLSVKGQDLTTLQAAEMVGEMALIDDARRFATATASMSGATLHSLDQPTFIKMIQANPGFALDVMRLMSERLRRWGDLFEDDFSTEEDNAEDGEALNPNLD